METHSKTAEKIKTYVDRADTKIQSIGQDVSQFIEQKQQKYHQEIDELKLQASLAKAEAKQRYEEQIKMANRKSHEWKVEAQTFLDEKVVPLMDKKDEVKSKLSEAADRTEEKWEEISEEMDTLIETTKEAFHNFTDTFKQRYKETD